MDADNKVVISGCWIGVRYHRDFEPIFTWHLFE